jgi:DNA-binding MarR family transcriptional regulator
MKSATKSTTTALSPGDTTNATFENHLTFLISTLGSRIALIAEQTLRKELDLSYMEWRVIQIVKTEPGTTPKRIIAITDVNKANVSRAINSLEQRRLLSRMYLDSHARHTTLFLTDAGKDVYRRGNALRVKGEAPLLEGLGESARKQLGNSLRRLMRNVDKMRNSDEKIEQ